MTETIERSPEEKERLLEFIKSENKPLTVEEIFEKLYRKRHKGQKREIKSVIYEKLNKKKVKENIQDLIKEGKIKEKSKKESDKISYYTE